MSISLFLAICLLVFIFGLGLALLIGVREKVELWGLGWLLGMGWSTWAWFGLYITAGVAFTWWSFFLILLAANAAVWIAVRLSLTLSTLPKSLLTLPKPSNWLLYLKTQPIVSLGVLIIASLSVFVLMQNLFWPVTDWDALALYDFRAKVMVETGSLVQGKELEYFFQYPLFTSALHALTYLSGLGVAKVWYAILYQAGLAVFWSLLRRRTTATLATLGTLFLASSPLLYYHSFMAYTNLSFTLFGALGFMYLWQWWEDEQVRQVLLGASLIGLSTWVRISEPFYLVGVVLILLGAFRQLWYRKLAKTTALWLVVAIALILFTRYPWDYLISSWFGANVNTPLSSLSLVQTWSPADFIARTGEVVAYLWTYSVQVYLWYLVLALGITANDVWHKRWSWVFSWFSMSAFLGMIFVGTLLLSFSLESWNRIGDSVARMSMFLLPLWVYLIFVSPSWYKQGERS